VYVPSARIPASVSRSPSRAFSTARPGAATKGPTSVVGGTFAGCSQERGAAAWQSKRRETRDLWPLARRGKAWLTHSMFARQEVVLDLDFPSARARLAALMRGDWLDSVSQNAYAEGTSGQLRVGPFGGVPAMSKLVEVRLLEPVPHDNIVIVPLRWEATGRMGRLFPVLDANLTLTEADGGLALLGLAGVYRPPLDGVGEELDQLVLHRVATATVRSLLNRLSVILTETPEVSEQAAPPP